MTTTPNPLAFVDCETTGLDPRVNQAYEVCIWREDHDSPHTYLLPHTLVGANIAGLNISRYFERQMDDIRPLNADADKRQIARLLHKATLVGSNPSFDANMLLNYLGVAVWHHRFIDVACMAMTVFDWDRPKGLFDVVQHLTSLGYTLPDPDHSARGDVVVTRAVYEILREHNADNLDAARSGATRGLLR